MTELEQKQFKEKFPFHMCGVSVERKTGEEYVGDCIFCTKENHFYVNSLTGQWNCKSCGNGGNIYSFIRKFHDEHCESLTDSPSGRAKLEKLAAFRKIPSEKILDVLPGIKYYEELERFVIPYYNAHDEIVTFRLYMPGEATIALTGTEVYMGGIQSLGNDLNVPVYLCEGEWDPVALSAMLEDAKELGNIVWIPGADTFKKGWEILVEGRPLVCCLDNDSAGDTGTKKIFNRTSGYVKSFKRVQWGQGAPKGFDVRDFYTAGGTFDVLKSRFVEYKAQDAVKSTDEATVPHWSDAIDRPKFTEVIDVLNSSMYFTPEYESAFKLFCAVIFAASVKPDVPLWIFLVAPPGGGKTALMSTCNDVRQSISLSSFTSKALVSGFSKLGGGDPSLIPKMLGKTVFLKDFTEILSKRPEEREEIFGIIRGAYDGTVNRQFANGIIRNYEGRFNIIAATTPAISSFRENNELGERFLMYRINTEEGQSNAELISAAISFSEDQEGKKRIVDTVGRFLNVRYSADDLPIVAKEDLVRIAAQAQICAVLRSGVKRDKRDERILERPLAEIATRIATQSVAILQCLTLVNEGLNTEDLDRRIIVKSMLDSSPRFNVHIVCYLAANPGSTQEALAAHCGVSKTSILRPLEDMEMLHGITMEIGEKDPEGEQRGQTARIYSLSPLMRNLWDTAQMDKYTRPVAKRKTEKLESKPNGSTNGHIIHKLKVIEPEKPAVKSLKFRIVGGN